MSERPTPETDALNASGKAHYMSLELARKLERQRDEARERVAELEAELQAWKAAAGNGAGCDTPEGLAAFIHCCNC